MFIVIISKMSTGKDKCSKGYSCGLGCISKNRTCLIEVVSSKVKDVLKKLKQAIKSLKPKKKVKKELKQNKGESNLDFAVRKYGQEIGDKKIEHVGVFNDKGEQVYSNTGNQNSVSMSHDSENLITVHNHPKPKSRKYSKNSKPMGSSFSPSDVSSSARSNEKQAIVYTAFGTKYTMTRPEGGWNEDLSDSLLVETVFQRFINQNVDNVIEPAKKAVKENRTKENVEKLSMALDNHVSDYSRNAMKYLSEEFNFEYKEESVDYA